MIRALDSDRHGMEVILCRDVDWLLSDEAFSIYSSCMYRPTRQAYRARMERFVSDPSVKVFVSETQGEKTGVLVLGRSGFAAEIVGIAVSKNRRCQGIGKTMIHHVMESEKLEKITAQTDDDAVGFYRKCGFTEEKTVTEYPDGVAVRYHCSLCKNKSCL